tara:strand:- start:344 stop:745 length:402 start_codon:yes stop_codon:yes gene_type:complete
MMGYLTGGLGLVLVIVLGAFKVYHDTTQETIQNYIVQLEVSKENQKQLEGLIAQQNESIDAQQRQHEAVVLALETMSEDNRSAQAELNRLQDKFRSHDLAGLSYAKPGLIQNIINRGTKRVAEDFRAISSDPL